MATVDLRTEARQMLDGLSDESLGVVVNLLTSLKNREHPKRTDLLLIYPWVQYLSDAECDEFFEELSNAAKDNGSGVDEVVNAWRETAEILADSDTMADIAESEKQLANGEEVSWDGMKQRLRNTAPEIDWLDTEYMEKARTEADDSITLESVRKALAKIPGSMSDFIISEREDRV